MNADLPTSPEAASLPTPLGSENTAAEGLAAIEKVSATLVSHPSLLRGLLSDAGGNPSSIRLAMLAGVVVVLAAWATVSLQTHTLQPIPESVVTLVTILTGAKLGQKFIEPKAGEDAAQ